MVRAVPKRGTVSTKAWYSGPASPAAILTALSLVITPLLLVSCDGRNGLLPPSGGRLYEVLLVGDKDNTVKAALQEDVPGLPQSEPQFDVSSIDEGRFNQSVSMARNIVKVETDSLRYSSVALRYQKDIWAAPQMVVYITTPSAQMLKDSIKSIAPTLLRLLNRSEINKLVSMLRTGRNVKAERLIRQMFGIGMWVPQDMTASRQGKDFLWLSNNSPSTMTNIVIYNDTERYKTEGKSQYYSDETERFVKTRNVILGKNIKGETDSMRMQTVDGTVSSRLNFESAHDRRLWLAGKRAEPILTFRGLWEMTGDDMGGPFVSRSMTMSLHEADGYTERHNIVVEGFVFAPGKKKRNATRQLEAILYTIKRQNNIKNYGQ